MASETFTVGAVLRPSFRMMCFQLGLGWEEQKGFLESAFRVVGSERGIQFIRDKIAEMEQEEADRLAAEVLERIRRQRRRDNRWYRRAWRWMGEQRAKFR